MKYILLLFLLLFIPLTGQSEWSLVGTKGFSVGIAYDVKLKINNGTPYVAFRDGGNSNKASVMKYNGTAWEYVGASSISTGYAESIAFEFNNGVPYLAFAEGGTISVKKFDGSNWVNLSVSGIATGGNAGQLSLAFDSDHVPYMLYGVFNTYNMYYLVKYNEAASSWGNYVTSNNLSTYLTNSFQPYQNLMLKIHNNVPYISYTHQGDQYVPHLIKAQTVTSVPTWSEVALNTTGQNANNLQFDFDSNHAIWIAYNNSLLQLAQLPFNNYSGGCSPFCYSTLNAFALDHENVPYVAMKYGTDKVLVLKNENYTYSRLDSASSGFYGSASTRIALAIDGTTPYIAYCDQSNKINVLKYQEPLATSDRSGWDEQSITCSPNPSSGSVRITMQKPVTNLQVDLLSSYGQLIERRNIENEASFLLTIEGSSGLYIVRLKDATTGQVTYRKVMKE